MGCLSLMAIRSKSICRQSGCGKLIDEPGHCALHMKQIETRRGSAHERGYGHRWRKARVTYLRRNPLCVHCANEGRVVPATEVDHIIPPKLKEAKDSGNAQRLALASARFWDTKNWQSLCKPHHSKKTADEDGGFGR